MFDHVPRLVRFQDLCAAAAIGDGRAALPHDVRRALDAAPTPVVLTDFAGRDSVAAAIAWLERHEVGTLVPVADLVPTRFGDWRVYEDNWHNLRARVADEFPAVRLTPWFVFEDVSAWKLLNGRYLDVLSQRFGFFTPCLGCHLHFYMMRAVLAEVVGASTLVSGEKELHGTRRKANQTREAVAAYAAFSAEHGVHQHFPIHQVTSEKEMQRLLGDDWKEGARQLRCVHSGNDRSLDGSLRFTPDQIRAYMHQFALPVAHHLVALRQAGVTGPALERAVDDHVQELLGSAP